ncbi:MAG: hypothetical protein AB8B67_03890 [Rickettsiaceae bacterium]
MRKTFKFNKIIRDRLSLIMSQNGVDVAVKSDISHHDLIKYFKEKILEEANEVKDATNKEEMIDELADLVEVVHGFARALEIEFTTIESKRQEKLDYKGGFNHAVIVDSVTLDSEHQWAKYYSKNPKKYPEIVN